MSRHPGDGAERLTQGRKVGLTLGALLAGALGIEAFVRVTYREEWDAPVIRKRQADANFAPLVRFTGDAELYYELQPGLDLDFHGSRVVTDAAGCRVPSRPRPHDAACPAGAAPLRVAVVGPSTTFGYKLPIEQSYPELLVPRLERLWRRPVELRNVSVPGYASVQEARVFTDRVLPWRPDLVLWHYDHRDAYPPIVPGDRIELPPEYGDNVLHCATLKLLRRRRQLAALEALRGDAGGQQLAEGYIVGGSLWDRHLRALSEVGAQAREQGIPVVLVLFDAFVQPGEKGRQHFAALHERLVPLLSGFGFRVLDLFPQYQSEMERRGWKDLRAWWRSVEPLDGHPNAAGHAFLAQAVADFLEQDAAELSLPAPDAAPSSPEPAAVETTKN